MNSNDEKLLKDLDEQGKQLMKMAVEVRDIFPGLSYTLFTTVETCRKAAARWKPVDADTEGDARSSWWYVCGECHTAIDSRDHYCRQCGRMIQWK